MTDNSTKAATDEVGQPISLQGLANPEIVAVLQTRRAALPLTCTPGPIGRVESVILSIKRTCA
jgi:hypothetical protein